jgi:hypothetical protein
MIEHFRLINIISLNADDRRLQVYRRMAEARSDAEKVDTRRVEILGKCSRLG